MKLNFSELCKKKYNKTFRDLSIKEKTSFLKYFLDKRKTPILDKNWIYKNQSTSIIFYSKKFETFCKQPHSVIKRSNGKSIDHNFKSVIDKTNYIKRVFLEKENIRINKNFVFKNDKTKIFYKDKFGNTLQTCWDYYFHSGLGNDIRSAVNKIDYAKNLFYRRGIENTGTPFIFKSTKWFKNDSSYVFSWKGYDYKMRYDNIDNNEKPSLKGLVDINHYIRSQFKLKKYIIVDDWKWSKSNKLITFEYKNKIYQLTWNNFQQGILINDDETNIYYVEMKYNNHKCKKVGISINEPDSRSTSYNKIIFKILLPTDLAIQLEKLVLAKTRKYTDRSTKLSNFRGKSECRKIIMPDKFVIDYIKFYSEKLLTRKEKLMLKYL